MKKVLRYEIVQVVEFEVSEQEEAERFPNGLDEEAMIEEMKSDYFDEITHGANLITYTAKGTLLENNKIVAVQEVDMKEKDDEE